MTEALGRCATELKGSCVVFETRAVNRISSDKANGATEEARLPSPFTKLTVIKTTTRCNQREQNSVISPDIQKIQSR
jgi:hypothetical protein